MTEVSNWCCNIEDTVQKPGKKPIVPSSNGTHGRKIVEKCIMLTPDQLNAFNGPNRHLIIGAAGTGKSIILQAKAMELLQRGDSVTVVVAQPALTHQWRCKIQPECPDVDDFALRIISKPLEQILNENLEQPLGSARSEDSNILALWKKQIAKDREKIWKSLQTLVGHGHLLIDDCETYLGIYILMKLAKCMSPGKVIWAAMDAYRLGDLQCFKKSFIKHAGMSISILKEVMRCTQAIFKYAFTNKHLKWVRKAKPVLGYCTMGLSVIIIKAHYQLADEAVDKIWNKIQKAIKYFAEKGIELGDIGIIVGPVQNETFSLSNYLRQKCCLSGIALVKMGDPSCKNDSSMLCIMEWSSTVSLEWPIVIYVCMGSKESFGQQDSTYQRYRALSRAKMTLIDICITYDIDKDMNGEGTVNGDHKVINDLSFAHDVIKPEDMSRQMI